MGQFAGKHPQLIGLLSGGVITVFGFIGALHYLNLAFVSIKTGFSILKTGIRVFRRFPVYVRFFRQLTHAQQLFTAAQKVGAIAAKGFSAAIGFMTSPIGLVILAVTALIAIGYLLYKHWDQVKAFFATMWEGAKSAVSKFTAYIKGKLTEAYNWVMDKWQKLTNFLSHPIEGTVNIVKKVMGGPIADATAKAQSEYDGYTNATGGIYGKGAFLTSFAENSPEAAIPIDGSPRAIGLWKETGRRLGMSTGGQISVNYSPRIEINGNADQAQIQQAMDMSLDRLKRMLRDLQQEKRRLAYD